MGSVVPPGIAALLQQAFTYMDGPMGILEDLQVYGRATVRDATGTPAARGMALLGTVRVYVDDGGGSLGTSVEGNRVTATQTIYFPRSTLLSTELYPQRWGMLSDRDAHMRRIATYGQLGPYAWVQLSGGGGGDTHGEPKA